MDSPVCMTTLSLLPGKGSRLELLISSGRNKVTIGILAVAGSEFWAPVMRSQRLCPGNGDLGWASANFLSQPEPRLLPHPHTVSLRTLYPCQKAGTVTVTRAEADVVHTSKIVSLGSLVGQVEKLILVSL